MIKYIKALKMEGKNMKKYLILYASYGGGHMSAAKSILEYINKNYSGVQVEMVDCMKYINKTTHITRTARMTYHH